ncbi:MarR family winged helix-turn-helix transcriptional regulator [Tamlana sp. 2201CG12-4]|uniref:MarR family winged helix-turn-helix transcriptional regulator n=1 Tax=Tamlana sp. 2201CG12-4 TaxID=3112582 RepID=UPI002DBE516E|nr:MarR family winged helix-turn-helix transcriptional regulator [Tamlana sp. 2201CG12-4]MEC3906661.1 MarR family winged helix-turn-helix transcriptional regulator [Tamlana sp. 2201CG12-4]
MSDSIFNPKNQETDLSGKIVAGLERISETFKVLLWEKAKLLGLSPIQIQILIFINYHKIAFCNVSHLAKEFNVTKPTISDAVRILNKKGMIKKVYSSSDSRRYTIQLSDSGKRIVSETENFAQPLKNQLTGIHNDDLEQTFKTLSQLIHKLNKIGILTVQRTCYACKFYQKKNNQHFCNLLEQELLDSDIRIDCPEFADIN